MADCEHLVGMPEEGKEETQQNLEVEPLKEPDKDGSYSPRGVLDIPILGSDSDQSSGSGSFSSSCSTREPAASPLALIKEPATQTGGGLHWWSVIDSLKRKSGRKWSTMTFIRSHESGSKKGLKKKLARNWSAEDGIDCGSLPVPKKPSWRNFDLAELAAATDNFSPDNLIGKGGHAEVYRGRLPDGQLVAVKKLIKKDKEEETRIADFLSELGIIAHIDHPNAARLLGFGVDGGLHLVLQFSPNGSLASLLHHGSVHIFPSLMIVYDVPDFLITNLQAFLRTLTSFVFVGSRDILIIDHPYTESNSVLAGLAENIDWKIRFKVAVGVAQGLQYLHYGCQRRIIHRDIKASNILLTDDYEPQISDFGLAKWLPDKWVQHVVFPIEGTFGYLAPEYFMHGIINEKTDVFAYGVLLLELITGRRAIDSSRQSLVMWAKPLLDKNNLKELTDPRLGDAYDLGEMKRAFLTASMCIHHLSTVRPDMNRVVRILKGEDGLLEWKQSSSSSRALLLDACDLDDYSSTTYLKDLNRHMQLLLE